jgi:hypothetical protein
MVIDLKMLAEGVERYGTAYVWRLPGGVHCWSHHIEDVPYGGYPAMVVEADGTIELTTTTREA